ncbi:hypothetical protein DFH27DRAFT_607398 [Peziza echinospora]|nr:hypothetical protein DFH27DRAFT_607398 [Peziza echinospora]
MAKTVINITGHRLIMLLIAFIVLFDVLSSGSGGFVHASPAGGISNGLGYNKNGNIKRDDTVKLPVEGLTCYKTHTATVSKTMTTTSTKVLTVTATATATATASVTKTVTITGITETVTETVTKECTGSITTSTIAATSTVTEEPTTTTAVESSTSSTASIEPTPTGPVLCPIKEEVLLDFDDITVGRTDFSIPEIYHNLDFPSWSGLDWLLVSTSTVSSPRGPQAITSLPNALLSPARGNYISFGASTPTFLFDLLSLNVSAWTNSGEGSNHADGLIFNVIGEKADGSRYPLRTVRGLEDGGGVRHVTSKETEEEGGFEGLVGLVRVWVAAWDTNAEKDVFGRMVSANFLLDDLRIAVRGVEC